MTAISDKSELCRLHQTLLSLESTTEVQKLDSKIILSLLEENYRLQEELKKQKEFEAADRADVEAYKKCSEYFKEENARLREALKSLANEADGFLQCADAMHHGVTNMRVLSMRINEARDALEGKE